MVNVIEEKEFVKRIIEVKLRGNNEKFYVSKYANNVSTVTINLTTSENEAENFIKSKKFFDVYVNVVNKTLETCKTSLLNDGQVEYVIQHTYFDKGEPTHQKRLAKINSSLSFIMPFGKYKGQTLNDIYNVEPSYIEWLYNEGKTCKVYNEVKTFLTAQKHVDIIIPGKISASNKQKELKEYIRNLCKKTNNGEKLPNDVSQYLIKEVFQYHPNVNEKILKKEIDFITIMDDDYKKNKAFYIVYKDGTYNDILWVKCLKNRMDNFFETYK